MAKIIEKENKKSDAIDFINKALEIETSGLNLISHDELKKCLAEMEREEL